MAHEPQLQMLMATFQKCHIQTLLLDPDQPVNPRADMGLRVLLGAAREECTFRELMPAMEERTVYRLTDSFLCSYVLLRLPDREREEVLLIGPYLSEELPHRQVLEQAESLGLDPRRLGQLENYYNNIPVLPATSHLFALLEAFGEYLWGAENFSVVTDIHYETAGEFAFVELGGNVPAPEDTVWNMQIMEARYAFENELIRAVTNGQAHKAERMLQEFSAMSFESRLADPLRNMKNYCIIMNTLMRKAAENGGVHPVYLDRMSSSFARKIELVTTTAAIEELMQEMLRSYCRLVKKHATRSYSPPIQKVIACVDADLTADLSLHTLAAMQNLSAGYLSTLFRQETGQTLTDFVNQRRIRLAKQLLSTTTLQIQTIAQHCGILDVHYFTRLFKKYANRTPREYREAQKQ